LAEEANQSFDVLGGCRQEGLILGLQGDSFPEDGDSRSNNGEDQQCRRKKRSLSLHLWCNGVMVGIISIGPSSTPARHIANQFGTRRLKSCQIKRTNPEHHAAQNINPISTQSPSDMAART
jgi:hypothetical protein